MRQGAVILLALLSGCNGEPDSAETRLRQILAEAEEAAERRETGFFRTLIAEDYTDRHGRSRSNMIDLARVYFLRNQSIHILSRIEAIEFSAPELARIELVAGLAGRDQEPSSAWEIQADVYRFELEMRLGDEGDWKLIDASWRRGARE